MFQELVNHITDFSVFTDSIREWVTHLSINSVIIFIMMSLYDCGGGRQNPRQ